jgi:hypothetical protein
MLVEPGPHQIKIALPGYSTFETDIQAQPEQKVEIKTDLLKSNVPLADPLLEPGSGGDTASSPAAEEGRGLPNAIAAPTRQR